MPKRRRRSLPELVILIVIFLLLTDTFRIGPLLVVLVPIGLIWYFVSNRKKMPKFDEDTFNQAFDSDAISEQMRNTFSNISRAGGIIVVGIIVLIALIKAITIIPAGKTGVVHLFGQVQDAELPSGFHLVNPLASVTHMSIRTEEYTMSVAYGEGQRSQADAIAALTKEGLSVELDITVFYRLIEEKASDVFKNLGEGYDEKIIRPEIRSAIREVIAQYEAKDVYSEKREEVANKIQETLNMNLEPRGIEAEQALLRNVNLPPKLAESIQSKLTAEQEAERLDFVLETERKEAERKRIEAEGQRDAQQIINQSLSNQYLQYLYINSLQDREGTIYVPTEGGAPLFRPIN